ncbi:hypothetical protein B0T25DRAFT_592256 [Lasiosphaeria hispida]|uniref:Cyclin N-terminal domain-containing protein n=1 Tax=Lasiosphaeria hispida TaxID=260671 RepID=A0AAJ0HAR5_9PEZI|nr:hypothetical protein B0T25DRAFT_592256 [Lasiosphaeria hispida]
MAPHVQFIYKPVQPEMIKHVASVISSIATIAPTPNDTIPPLETFITILVRSSGVKAGTFISTLVYINRLKSRFPIRRCTEHHIFLATLILAAKYLNDSSPWNRRWAECTVMSNTINTFGFSYTEVNKMERQMLALLNWDLHIDEEELYRELDHFI